MRDPGEDHLMQELSSNHEPILVLGCYCPFPGGAGTFAHRLPLNTHNSLMFAVWQFQFHGRAIVLILQMLCDDVFYRPALGVVFESPTVSSLTLRYHSPSEGQKQLGLLMRTP